MKKKNLLLLSIITLLCLLLSSYEFAVLLNNLFGIHKSIPITFFRLTSCILGTFCIYQLCKLILDISVKILIKKSSVKSKKQIKENLKHNWYFPITTLSFFLINITDTKGYNYGILISFLISIIISTQINTIWKLSKNNSTTLKLISLASATGICLENQTTLYIYKDLFSNNTLFQFIYIICTFTAIPFVYFCTLYFFNKLKNIFKENKIFNNISNIEKFIYSILLILTFGYMIFSYTKSQAFYEPNHYYDIIYTSDSPALIRDSVYLSLTHLENDIRQPLFAVFSAPFFGIPYLITKVFKSSIMIQAVLINIIQIILLFISNFLLTKILNLNSTKRICFILISSCTYTYLLFTLMQEQYIMAYFWLILCIYFIIKEKPNHITLYGAGGTLLTSMILLPLMSKKSPIKQFKKWILDIIKYGLEFTVLLLTFCRFDVIFNLLQKYLTLSQFTGRTIPFTDKIYQYTEFIKNCFISPRAGINTTLYDYISWQLNQVTNISIIGVIILILVAISIIINKDKKISLLAAGWIAFSIIILVILGWGTKENGLILYSLYFGWPYFILLFQLIEKIEQKLKVNFLLPSITIITSIILLTINIPAIIEMIKFAIKYYPI